MPKIRSTFLLIFVLCTALLVVALPAVAAPASESLSDTQLQQLSQNCRQAQVQLRSVQKRDTVLRINRGRLYDMTLRQTGAFVARLDMNKMDSSGVKPGDSAIRADVQRFKDDYDTYAGYLDHALDIDCVQKPREFYALLGQAAQTRTAVGADVATIKQHIGEYTNALAKLEVQIFPGEGSGQ